MTIKELLQFAIDKNASDLHLVVGVPPVIRIDGRLVPVPDEPILTVETIESLMRESMTAEQLERLSVNKEVDFSLAFSNKARFRVNAYTEKKAWASSYRRIPLDIPQLDSLGLPSGVKSFTHLKQGFILVTGPTGHGKSTTLAAILDEINRTRSEHIVTIEDPIEFIFQPRNSIISQREMGTDTHSWNIALRSVLREDPDVVLVGEMRDYETISAALTIAETGHLVFATLHTNSASQTIDRIVDYFPAERQTQVRMQLSSVLEAVVSQRLIPADNGGRVVAHELMFGTTAIRTAIREGKTHQIDSIIQTSQEYGMNTLESSLAQLVQRGVVSMEHAKQYALHPDRLARYVHSAASQEKSQ